MPIIKSAKKALRSSRRKRLINDRRKRTMKESIKETKKLFADPKAAAIKLKDAYQAIDKAAKRGIIKKNTAARKKSRLARALAKTK